MSTEPVERLMRLDELEEVLGIKRSSIYKEISAGRLAAPLKVTRRASAWPASEVRAFIDARIAERNAAGVRP